MKTKLKCPDCSSDQVKRIVYGLPDFNNFDFEKNEVGGCCVTGDDPKYKCTSCESSW
jgi:transposase-like protein